MSPPRAERAPEPLPGFGRVLRYLDPRTASWTAQVLPGECYVTAHDEIIQTVLGSCVAVCARDPATGIGGMNHYMLPGQGRGLRFGENALERLLKALEEQGARRETLEVKLFGGGRVISSMRRASSDIGQLNVDFIRSALEVRGLVAVAESLGGTCARHLRYAPATGKAWLRSMNMGQPG